VPGPVPGSVPEAEIGLNAVVSIVEVLRRLPDISRVRDTSQAIAMLDAILSPDWSSRCFSFAPEWAPGEALASMHDGSGDEYSILFSAAGACARGFSHRSPMSPLRSTPPAPWPGLLEGVPDAFRSLVEEPSDGVQSGPPPATVCFWRRSQDPAWSCGNIELPTGTPDPDGADELFRVLSGGGPAGYQEFAQERYDRDVDLRAVQHAYDLRPLTRSVVAELNPDRELADLEPDRKQIGYPAPAEGELPDRPHRSFWGWPLL
jgi:hypothetical protein